MEWVKIILLAIAAAVTYGIVHDQITARICVEYFTIGHPPIFGTEDPTLLGIGWGILATWWVGLFLGVPAAVVARVGSWPKRDARWLLGPIAVLMAVSAVGATLAGLVAWLGGHVSVQLPPSLADQIPPEKHAGFIIDGFAHSASYGCGFVGGLILMAYIFRSRQKEAAAHPRATSHAPTPQLESGPV